MAIRIPRIQPTERAIKWGFNATVAAAWTALVLTVMLGAAVLLHKDQRPIDVQREINKFTKSQFFAQNFFLVWAGGDPKDAEKLASMTALPGQPDLNPDPFTVLYINASDVKATPADAQTEWEWVLGATIVLPNAGTSTRTYYKVTILESAGSFKALQWPRPVNDTARNFEVKPYYTIGTATTGPLGTTVSNFMKAYYTAGNAGSSADSSPRISPTHPSRHPHTPRSTSKRSSSAKTASIRHKPGQETLSTPVSPRKPPTARKHTTSSTRH